MKVPNPRIEMFVLRDFLSDSESDMLAARIELDRRP